jgi:hypothetical protein
LGVSIFGKIEEWNDDEWMVVNVELWGIYGR